MSRNFIYHTTAKNEAEAISLCEQCHSKPFKIRNSTSTYSNVTIDKAVLKDGVWTVTGTIDVLITPGGTV